ncbi:MAG: YraN family protein [Solirubrobacterales bacterium]
MTQARLRTGRTGEEIARAHLRAAGMRIVERNARTRYGELDLIALDGSTLVFIEVKTTHEGNRRGPERPELAVGRRKQLQVRRLARAWLAEATPPRHAAMRFDVVGVRLRPDGHGTLRHIRDAF